MSTQWNAPIRPSNSGGCQANQLTKTGAGCFDLTSASATTLCRLLLTSDQISTGFLLGNAAAYACTTSRALSPNPAPKPALAFTFSTTSSSVTVCSDASIHAGACSFIVEQMIIGTCEA